MLAGSRFSSSCAATQRRMDGWMMIADAIKLFREVNLCYYFSMTLDELNNFHEGTQQNAHKSYEWKYSKLSRSLVIVIF